MDKSNIYDISQVICNSIDSPLLVCQPTQIINCNESFSKALGYESIEKIRDLDINYLFNKHFIYSDKLETSKKYTIDKLLWVKYQSSLGDRIASVRVKQANSFGLEYYTVNFHDELLNEHNVTNSKPDNLNSPVLQPKQFSNQSTFSSENVFDPSKYDLTQLSREEIFERFYRMIYSIPCSLFIVNADNTHCYVNEYHQMLFGSDTYESWAECIHPQDVELHLRRWKHSMKSGEPLTNSRVRIRKHPSIISENQPNTYTLYVINIYPFWDKSGKTIVNWLGVCTDIQELKDAQESSELKSKFLSMMSHEFRTPLFGIIGSTSLLMDSTLDAEQLENVKNINRSAELLLVVIQDILDFSKIESETLSLNPEQFNINNLIKDTYHMFQSLAKSKLIDFKVNYPEKNYELIGDSARLLQILVNLTSNSLKFTRQGFVNISCNLTTNYQFAKVCFCIEDTGIGIPPESIPDLFRPWSQASNAKTEYIGSGLGLCICRSLIDLMQGNINIESEVGRGTKIWFTVDLPLAYPEQVDQVEEIGAKTVFDSILPGVESPAQKLSKVNPLYRSNNLADKFQCQKVHEFDTNLKRKRPVLSNSITNGEGKTTGANSQSIDSPISDPSHTHFILIAEDNPVNQIIIKKYISKLSTVGFVLVSDGKLAWEEYQKHPAGYFDVILLDHLMPEMGGDEVCKLIKEKDPSQKIISVSANALPTDIEYFKQIGMDDFLEKPFTFPKFKTLLQKWLKELE